MLEVSSQRRAGENPGLKDCAACLRVQSINESSSSGTEWFCVTSLRQNPAILNRRVGWKLCTDHISLSPKVSVTVVGPVRCDGTARPRAATTDGAALIEARRKTERTYPELAGAGGRVRLVVLLAEVGGRWSTETAQFLSGLAKARAQEPVVLQARAEAAWLRRWSNILACSAARAFALSLLDLRPAPAVEDIPSVDEILRDARFA